MQKVSMYSLETVL